MPVSTRSQLTNQGKNEPSPEQRTRPRLDQEENNTNIPYRNPHHGLKEKMKALTLLYEQQKRASLSLKNRYSMAEDQRVTTQPRVELQGSCKNEEENKTKPNSQVMRENSMPNSTITRTYVLPLPPNHEAKENVAMVGIGGGGGGGGDRIVSFSACPRKSTASKTVARKLSLGSLAPQMETKGADLSKNVQETEKLETVSAKTRIGGSRIFVYVRLRPMAKKEKEMGSRCCVRIVNRRDVYLTEFANENDYLRLKRLRGRHFTFDSSFPETTSQQEVYLTS